LTRSPNTPSGGEGPNDNGLGAVNGKGSRLDQAARSWMKNGYSVRYRDPYLIQLAKRRNPDVWLLVPLAALGVASVFVFVAMLRRLLRERWHVVELTVTPDQRIIMHKMWAPHPPDD